MRTPFRTRVSATVWLSVAAFCGLAVVLAGVNGSTTTLHAARISVRGMVTDSRTGKAVDGAQVTFTDVSLLGGKKANLAHLSGPPWGASRPRSADDPQFYAKVLGKSEEGCVAIADDFKWCREYGVLEWNARRLGLDRKQSGGFAITISKEGFASETRRFDLWNLPESEGTRFVDLGNVSLAPITDADRGS